MSVFRFLDQVWFGSLIPKMATVDAMRVANKEMKKQYKGIDIDKIEVSLRVFGFDRNGTLGWRPSASMSVAVDFRADFRKYTTTWRTSLSKPTRFRKV